MDTQTVVCPICDEHIELHTRKDFESFDTTEYSKHIHEQHPEEVTKREISYARILLPDTGEHHVGGN